MRRILWIGGPLVLVIGLVVAWYLFSPLLFDDVVDEQLVEVGAEQILSTGSFSGVDAWHQGSGTARLVQLATGDIEIQFENFSVTNGPDLEVWLSNHEFPRENGDVSGGEWIDLGRLSGNVGNQAYTLPADADLSKVKSVTIWCEQFGVLFASAPLAPAADS